VLEEAAGGEVTYGPNYSDEDRRNMRYGLNYIKNVYGPRDPLEIVAAMMVQMNLTKFVITDEALMVLPMNTQVRIFRDPVRMQYTIEIVPTPIMPDQEPQGPPETYRAHSSRMDKPKEIEG
jgi:hypothetical protein